MNRQKTVECANCSTFHWVDVNDNGKDFVCTECTCETFHEVKIGMVNK